MARHYTYKMVQVVERFVDEKGIPRERLACGRVRTDPIFHYGNEKAFMVRRVYQEFTGELPKARCSCSVCVPENERRRW